MKTQLVSIGKSFVGLARHSSRWRPALACLVLLALAVMPNRAQGGGAQANAALLAPLGTGFTYQGRLTDGGNPANGQYDFQFGLYDAPTGGSAIAAVTVGDQQVTDGLFTVQLDFGQVYTGTARFLEIGVRPGTSTGAYTTLAPRQQLAPTPYALALPGLWTQQNGTSPNLIGGYSGNSVGGGVVGATVGGGGASDSPNRALGSYATIGGGYDNTAGGPWGATIGGGYNNATNSSYTTVGGGRDNIAYDPYATIGGGNNNTADDLYATIGGGDRNTADGTRATIGGGQFNTVNSAYATIGGGYDNTASGEFVIVGGGQYNTANSDHATVGGGRSNSASGAAATVGGGWGNYATGYRATIGGGYYNTAGGEYTTVGGGGGNVVTATYATIGGGLDNTATGGTATIGGGEGNVVTATHATIGGGSANTASHIGATIGGGSANTADDLYVTVGGGSSNTAGGIRATVGGGYFNTASGEVATISGGSTNSASGNSSTVSGGTLNSASGLRATVGGGYDNTAQGDYSFAAGNRAKANNSGCFVWGDSTNADVACNDDNRTIFRSTGGFYIYTDNSTPTPSGLYLAAGGSAWNTHSDRNVKKNFQPVDAQELLDRLAQVPISTWNYKSQDPVIRHVGPMAQDFNALLPGLGGEGETYINTLDADGVALAAIQGLYSQNQALQKENAAQQRQIVTQQKQIDALEARLAALEQGTVSPAPITGVPTWSLLGGLVAIAGVVAIVQYQGRPLLRKGGQR